MSFVLDAVSRAAIAFIVVAVACKQTGSSAATAPAGTKEGDRIVVSKLVDGHYQLVEIGLDGRAPASLTAGAVDSMNPSASPNAHSIAFIERDGMHDSLRILDRTSKQTRTVRDGGDSSFSPPSWSASGETIVVARMSRTAGPRIELVDVKSGRARDVGSGFAPCFDFERGRVDCLTTDARSVATFDLGSRSRDDELIQVAVEPRSPLDCSSLRAARARQLIAYTRNTSTLEGAAAAMEEFRCGVVDVYSRKDADVAIPGAFRVCDFIGDGSGLLIVAKRGARWELLRVDWRTKEEALVAADVGESANATAVPTARSAIEVDGVPPGSYIDPRIDLETVLSIATDFVDLVHAEEFRAATRLARSGTIVSSELEWAKDHDRSGEDLEDWISHVRSVDPRLTSYRIEFSSPDRAVVVCDAPDSTPDEPVQWSIALTRGGFEGLALFNGAPFAKEWGVSGFTIAPSFPRSWSRREPMTASDRDRETFIKFFEDPSTRPRPSTSGFLTEAPPDVLKHVWLGVTENPRLDRSTRIRIIHWTPCSPYGESDGSWYDVSFFLEGSCVCVAAMVELARSTDPADKNWKLSRFILMGACGHA